MKRVAEFAGLLLLGVMPTVFYFTVIRSLTEANDAKKLSVATLAVVIFMSLLALLVAAVLLVLLVRLAGLLARRFDLFGATPTDRILGLGITSLIFPTATVKCLVVSLRFLGSVVYVIPSAILRLTEGYARSRVLGQSPDDHIQGLQTFFQETVSGCQAACADFLAQFPFSDFLLALACWVVIGRLLAVQASQDASQSSGGPLRLIQMLKSISPVARQNFMLACVFVGGAYLSTAAIVAIPWLRGLNMSSDLGVQQLKEKLENAVMTQREFDERFPKTYGEEVKPCEAGKEFVARQQAALTSGTVTIKGPTRLQEWKKVLQEAVYWMNTWEDQRKSLLSKWKKFRDEAWTEKEKRLRSALSTFEMHNLRGMGAPERTDYFLRVEDWYKAQGKSLEMSLSSCMAFIDFRNKMWTRDTEDSVEELEIVLKDPQNTKNSTEPLSIRRPEAFMGGSSADFDLRRRERELFKIPTDDSRLPNPPDPGLELGPFGFFSRWLLKTRSHPLTLVCGMLGFGLLGTATSSFVRQQHKRKAGEPLVNDLPSVVVRGVSAAVILFLTVEGGLAVLTTGTEQPNAYVLFFLCIVGAVFSEDVWEWARKKLLGNLSEEHEPKESPEAPAAAPKPEEPKQPCG